MCNSNSALAVYYINASALGLTSGLDAVAGTFAWEPRAGFFAPFDLSYVRSAGLPPSRASAFASASADHRSFSGGGQACPTADLKVRTTTACDNEQIEVT